MSLLRSVIDRLKRTPPTPYVCVFHYPVHIISVCDGQHLNGPFGGMEIPKHEHSHVQVWHRSEFSRDDIVDPAVLSSCKTFRVGCEVRRYFEQQHARLENFEDRIMVIPSGHGVHNGYFAGFAANLIDAQYFVATGNRRRLVTPW